ncbi:DUF3793 family protein [Clostridium sp. A1-XYC3]|uniref:DUF3793 family protein n=1 Tax=Clostridium tanneri TaxID=3037988 RepID=A0ABU4JW50_9CLOT|nr:DUF3793 family protein [Clostridium sp. A1-XYC3]MDW8802395.1 DUF3793 family protein [Clostridium sp. A1-XYC3]
MSKDELISFVNIVNNYNDIEYLFSTIVCSTSPTLAKEKVSSLLTFSNDNRNLQNTWEEYKEQIKDILEVKFFELKKNEKNTIVLFYNEEELRNTIREEKNMKFLSRFGYSKEMNLEEYLCLLSKRFENQCPHEIGIFLGYPIEDVIVFTECPNKKCKMAGYWKVYHNLEEAKSIFKKYDEIKHNIIRMIIRGTKPVEILGSNVIANSMC